MRVIWRTICGVTAKNIRIILTEKIGLLFITSKFEFFLYFCSVHFWLSILYKGTFRLTFLLSLRRCYFSVVVRLKCLSFFIYEVTNLKLALLMFYDILRNISGPVIFKKINFFGVIVTRIVPKSGDRKICEGTC